MKGMYNIFEERKDDLQIELWEKILCLEPPYRQTKIEYSDYKDIVKTKKICIDSYCEKCDDKKVFLCNINKELEEMLGDWLSARPMPGYVNNLSDEDVFKNKLYFIDLVFSCAKCGEKHHYSLMFKGDIVIKIGQYPSFAREEEQKLLKYRNLISKFYIELKQSVSAYSQHMGIAAFVYLRRIFEYIIENEYDKINTEISEKKVSFDEKMKAVDKKWNIIPDELDSQKSKIYQVLSKGIHEYEEEECYELYPYMKTIILIILDKYLYEKDKAIQLKELSKMLGNI
ncbi:MAG: hypothetical protein J6A73_05985 [Lachnospiraceae bacterium]|nr:hypothetical protein [Lachnospiraceae bacterium]